MIPHDTEAELLRRLIRAAALGSEPVGDVGAVDWLRFARLVSAHHVQSLLVHAMQRSPAIPRAIVDPLTDQARLLRIRESVLRLECARVTGLLEASGCEPILLKGAGLALVAYLDPGDRLYSDLDVLVPRERLEEACRAVASIGFAEPRAARATSTLYDVHHFHRVLESPMGIRLELHWDLTRPGSAVRFDLEALRRRSRVVIDEGAPFRVLSVVDQYLHTASQCMNDAFSELRRVIDAALLLRAGAASGEPDIVVLAQEQGLPTAAWYLGELTDSILGVRLPEPHRVALRPSAFVARCLRSTDGAGRLLAARGRRSGDRQLVRWLCSPTLRDALRAVRHYVFPNEADVFDDAPGSDEGASGARFGSATLRRSASTARALAAQSLRLLTYRAN